MGAGPVRAAGQGMGTALVWSAPALRLLLSDKLVSVSVEKFS